MDALSGKAIDALTEAVASLLPAFPPEVRPSLAASPLRITPTGLGGLVGIDSEARVLGRRLEAEVVITAKAPSPEDLVSAVTAITRSLLAADRKTLLEMGLLGLELEGMGPKPTAQAGGPGTLERDLTFRVLFEFIEKPGEEEGIITTIPLDIRIG